jgi:fucose permease
MLSVATAACVCTLCLALVGDGPVGTAGLFGAALFLSITFPTIFGEAVRNTGELIKSASGLLVVAAGLGAMAAGNFLRWALAAGYVHLSVAAAIMCYGVALVAVLAMRRLRKEIPAVPLDSMIASA